MTRTAPSWSGGIAAALALLAIALLPSCAGTPATPGVSALVATPIVLPSFGHVVPGKPVDVYVRLARLSKACWFAPPAPLQVGYVFTAEVNPEGKGGGASIVIYEHNPGAIHGANAERGLKAFEVTLSQGGLGGTESTVIATANSRIPEAFAGRMRSDVERWADGDTSCGSTAPWVTNAVSGDATATGKPGSQVWKAVAH